MEEERPRFLGRWILQISVLSIIALLLFWGFYAFDVAHPDGARELLVDSALGQYLAFDPLSLSDALSSLAGVMAAVFGIVVTVVSIIVQLAANRFAGVTRMFLTDRVNLAVIGYYIVVCVCGVWLSPSLQSSFVPSTALLAVLVLTTLGLVLMAPYFGYVFWFLEPMNIIGRIRRRAQTSVRDLQTDDDEARFRAQAGALGAMEELTDIAARSISDKDKIIASGAVDALCHFALHYIPRKEASRKQWFVIGPYIAQNPDFVAMDAESLRELEGRKTWVEWKVMRQYLGIYNDALSHMRDINYLIAIDTRYIGEAALDQGDRKLSELVYRFMNSYLRATLNAGNVRTAYNVMNQYRLLIEAMLRKRADDLAVEGVGYMKYYGHIGFDQNLTFVTETVAYDLSVLCEVAHRLGSRCEDALLDQFLELDRPLRSKLQERGLLGVRKAQVKLACYYLANDERGKAQRIAKDVREEPKERLHTIRQQLERVRSKDFWEIIDRGRNFEFMEKAQRAQLPVFFDLLIVGKFDEEPQSSKPSVASVTSE